MIDLKPVSVKKEMSMYEIKSSIDMIDERRKELLKFRGEVACGEYRWDSESYREEYVKLGKVRKKLRGIVIERALKTANL